MQKIHEKTEIKVSDLVAFAGVSKSTWHEWRTRKGIETRHNHETPKLNWYTPEERTAVVKYVLTHKDFLYGYRYLAWQMIDENVAFVRPASVYNIMKEYDLVHKWAKNEGEAKKKGFDQPEAPHEQWHTDISYIKVLGVFYYFISIMDGYSRKILDWALCENMEGINIELLVARVKEKYPEAKARIIHDNGKQLTGLNGGDQVSRVQDNSLFERYPFCREPYSVTVCRIESENNVHVILEAFSEMLDETLVFVGNWEKSEYGRSLKEKFSVCKNIHLLAPIYEPHIVNWLRSNAHVYIHGHSAGGTHPSLVEAMNLSIPILAFDCVYNRATTEEKCLYWKSSDDLQDLMKNKSGKFAEIAREMGEAGKRLYSWERIARQYNALYQ